MTLCVCGVHRRVRVAPTHGYYAPERGWRQLHSREVSGEQKVKKKRTECDFSESHAHKMVPGGLVELFHQQTHHVT